MYMFSPPLCVSPQNGTTPRRIGTFNIMSDGSQVGKVTDHEFGPGRL